VTPALAAAVATVAGLGLVPKVAGAFASILGLALAVGADAVGGSWAVLALGIGLAALGAWACEVVLRAAAEGRMAIEPHRLVVRELAGQVLVLAAAPMNPAGLVLAFGAFQLFVLARPWPAVASLVHVPRGVSTMADGVLAALGAALVVGFMTWTLGSV
jgi:phosphatidylglycerophosphatase A